MERIHTARKWKESTTAQNNNDTDNDNGNGNDNDNDHGLLRREAPAAAGFLREPAFAMARKGRKSAPRFDNLSHNGYGNISTLMPLIGHSPQPANARGPPSCSPPRGAGLRAAGPPPGGASVHHPKALLSARAFEPRARALGRRQFQFKSNTNHNMICNHNNTHKIIIVIRRPSGGGAEKLR